MKKRAHHHPKPVHEAPEEATPHVHTHEVPDGVIDEGLSAIYGDERDDLQTFAKAPNPLTRFLVRAIIVLFSLCVLAGVGYFVYSTWFAGDRSGKPLAMTFVMPDDVQSGAETTIELDYSNTTAYPLTAVRIDMNVPSGFVPSAAEPSMTDVEKLSWDLGTIGAQSDGKITLKGTWYADVPSTTGVQALAEYKPANFNASFHDIATKTVTTTTSTTTVSIDAPETINAGETMTYTITVQASGTTVVTAPSVQVTLPTGFFITSTTPVIPAGGASTWMLTDLVPETPQTIVIIGAFASDVSGDEVLTVASGIAGTRFSPQATATALTKVEPSALALTMVGNGSTGSVTADPGSTFRLSIRLENTSSAPITDAAALVDFTAEDNLPISWSAASLDGGKVTAKGITYDATAIGTIAPGDHAIVNLLLPLKTDLAAVSSTFSIAGSATYSGITVSASPITVSLNSDASVSSLLRYYDDDGSPLGSGPLPPTVGSATHYRAIWSVNAGSHDLKDVTLSATLPDGVVWDDFSTATGGSITYDASTRVVRWTISGIPAGSSDVSARMSVSFTPTSADVGTEKTMMGRAVMTAKDDTTGSMLERSDDAVTTACEGDVLAVGKGTVK